MPDFAITLAHWAAWAPGLEGPGDWAGWDGSHPRGGESGPALSWLPPMQRRRLPPLARAVFDVARRAAGDQAARVPTVIASRHGELSRTLNLLVSLADGTPVSPAAFSLSVHNAVSGQLSIALGNRAPASCVALGGDGLTGALIEALCLKHPGEPVLLLAYDAPLPDCYRPYCHDEPFPWALALLIDDHGRRYRLHDAPPDGEPRPQGPALASFLARGAERLILTGERRAWYWSRLDDT